MEIKQKEKNLECPEWIWEEEEKQLEELHKEIKKRNMEEKSRIEKEIGYISSDQYEEQDSPMIKATSNKKVTKIKETIESNLEFNRNPYFAHLELIDDENTLNLYLTERSTPPLDHLNDGTAIISITGKGPLVEKIASNYYNQSLDDIHFNGATYRYDLYRTIKINEGILANVYPLLQMKDEDEHYAAKLKNITDMFLLEILNSKRNDKQMSSIIVSIQKQQYEIISEHEKVSYIVNGCAGSGKTAIMIHRLHFMKERNKKIEWENVKIITPSPLFKDYSANMMREYNLDKVEQFSIEEYYWNEIIRYSSYFRSREKNIISNYSYYPEEFIEDFFSNKMLEQLQFGINSLIEKVFLVAKGYGIQPEFKQADLNRRLKSIFLQIDLFTTGWHTYRDSIEQIDGYKELVNEKSYFEKELQKLKKRISKYSMELSEQWNKYAECSTENDQNSIQKKINNLTFKVEKIRKEIEENKELLDICVDELNDMYKSDIEGFNAFGKYASIKDLEKIKVFSENFERNLFNEILRQYINPIKEKFGVETENSYLKLKEITKVELWTLLMIFVCINGTYEKAANGLICIDEGQNLNAKEYDLIRDLNSNIPINIYGDLKQKLYNNVGIKNWNELKEYKYFELKQNYRNPVEIVDFCNLHMGSQMEGFGVQGASVEVISISYLKQTDTVERIEEFIKNAKGEIVIIVKKYNCFKYLNINLNIHEKMRYMDNGKVTYNDDIINILPVHAIVGMEFPNVIVFTKDMNLSQQYVSCTRTLNNLVIIR